MIAAVSRKRVQALSQAEFYAACVRIHAKWLAKGCPAQDDMPRAMLAEWLLLREETLRRGVQLRLFEGYDADLG